MVIKNDYAHSTQKYAVSIKEIGGNTQILIMIAALYIFPYIEIYIQIIIRINLLELHWG